MKEKYHRNCPKCNIDIIYKSRGGIWYANKNNTKCKDCRKTIKTTERNCPLCNEKIIYGSYMACYTGTKNNSNCRKCCNKLSNKPATIEKQCFVCNKIKLKSKFYKNASRPDGLCHLCKECDNQKRMNMVKTNIQSRLRKNLRIRLLCAIKTNAKNGSKVGSAISDLGCSVEKFKKYIENLFYPNHKTGEIMTWNNWTSDGWHIDHIIPLSSFDLTDRNQLLKACHYTNLQPLWAEENLKKGNKIK